nr:hypothetical protein [Candidatus Njordarchaeota archaeon]
MEMDLSMAWTEFENGASVYRIAQEHNVRYATARDSLLHYDPKKYRKIMDRRERRGKPIPIKLLNKVIRETEHGHKLKDLANKYNVGFTTLRRRLPRIMGMRNYKKIMDDHQRRRISITTLRKIGNELKEGATVKRLAKKHGIGESTLCRRLPQVIGRKKYDAIVHKRTWPRISSTLISNAQKKLENGESVNQIAREQDVSTNTLRRRLSQTMGRDRYRELTKTHLCKPVPLTVLRRIAKRVQTGELLLKLATEYGIGYRTLRRRLASLIGRKKYRRLMKATASSKRRIPGCFGSKEARKQGADSQFEHQVKTLLEKYKVKFEFHRPLKLGKHRTFPDFTLPNHVILETAGLSFKDYWKYYRRKTGYYIEADYKVFVVVLDGLYKRAMKYLPSDVTIIRFSGFKSNIEDYIRALVNANLDSCP